ncbi:hypothetical protein KR093_010680, partial [Drosophila rubida]
QNPGVHQITVSGINPFNVLCYNHLADLGWIVIQQQIGKGENFNRSWATYREGFGSFNGDFFLGLEKIHCLTRSRRYELLVEYLKVDGPTQYVRYNNFKISDESTGYALSLGEFDGNVNVLKDSDKMKFSTFDRNNCQDSSNCAELVGCGWWYDYWSTS